MQPPPASASKPPSSSKRLVTEADVDHLNAGLQNYLDNYTALSVRLMGRWPAFVPEEERRLDRLARPPPAPAAPAFAVAPAPSGWPAGPSSARAPSSARSEEPLPAAAPAAAARQPTRGSMASELSSRGESFRLQWKAAATAVKTEGMAELRETIERLREKLRIETTEKTKAVGEAVKRGKALAALQKGHTSLQELHARVVTQLDASQANVLRLEEELRNRLAELETANAAASRDRKGRHVAEIRLGKVQRQAAPVTQELAMLGEALSASEESRKHAEGSLSARQGE